MACHDVGPRSRALLGALVLALGIPQVAVAQAFWNTELLGSFKRGSRDVYAAVWGYTAPDGTEIAIIGSADGTSFIDATNPRVLAEVQFVRGPTSIWREMQTHGHYAYIVTEGGGGMQIVDLVDPHNPVLVNTYDASFSTAHTIHIRDGFAYVNGTNRGLRILDLADPVHPVEVGVWDTRYTHDSFVRGDILYTCNINSGGFTSVDVSDKAHPQELAFTQYNGPTHNAWSTEDGNFLLTTDEVDGGHLRIWDVANPRSPNLVAEWSADATASIHNVVVKGDSAYIAYYTEGLQVLDISDPRAPLQVGYYDTWPGLSGGFSGNWGVYPFARNGSIYLSDIQGGLFVVKMATGGAPVLDFRLSAPSSRLASPGQSQILFFFDIFNGASGARVFDLTASTNAGWPVNVQPQITVPRTGTEAVLVTVQVPPSIASPMRVDVQLCAQSQTTAHSACARTKIAVPVTLQSFEATPDGDGIDLRWRLARDGDEQGVLVMARAVAGGAFEGLARLHLDTDRFHDTNVVPGTTYAYRLVFEVAGEPHVLGEVRLELAAPATSRLLGNVPNPFNPSTQIRFELARAGDVELDVHDVRGRLLRRLSGSGLAPGVHAVTWDGQDDAGRPQPSGIYLYEIFSRGWRERGRMTLVR